MRGEEILYMLKLKKKIWVSLVLIGTLVIAVILVGAPNVSKNVVNAEINLDDANIKEIQ